VCAVNDSGGKLGQFVRVDGLDPAHMTENVSLNTIVSILKTYQAFELATGGGWLDRVLVKRRRKARCRQSRQVL
jgi:hypothetical protein